MNNNDSTQLYGLIGNPVKHSASRDMHNAAFQKLQLLADYRLLCVERGHFRKDFKHFYEKEGYQGFNITFPYKKQALSCIDTDKLSKEAKFIGAVNTVKITNKEPYGYNTDGIGFIRAFEDKFNESITEKSITLVGCGGAGSAIAIQAVKNGVSQVILADKVSASLSELEIKIRKVEKNCNIFTIDLGLSGNKAPLKGIQIELTQYDLIADSILKEQKKLAKIPETDVLIDATPLGMNLDDDRSILCDFIDKKHYVCDLVYHPSKTPLLRVAQEKGARFMNGFGMLLYQGVAAVHGVVHDWSGILIFVFAFMFLFSCEKGLRLLPGKKEY
ncbi:shikimate dehydrogenase family protein [Chlamydiota bacterium]